MNLKYNSSESVKLNLEKFELDILNNEKIEYRRKNGYKRIENLSHEFICPSRIIEVLELNTKSLDSNSVDLFTFKKVSPLRVLRELKFYIKNNNYLEYLGNN